MRALTWSRNNYVYWSQKKRRWIVYNSASGAIASLDRANYAQLIRLKDRPELVDNYSNSEELIQAQILVPDDDLAAEKTRSAVLHNRLSTDVLHLTIAPTLACNFGCAYCFQRQLPKQTMTGQTEDSLIRFIRKTASNAHRLTISWFGGEPLLAMGRIKSIYRRVKEEIGLPVDSHVTTNGYLLDEAAATTLRDLGVSSYQVTIDGLRRTHDRRRPLLNGRGTFETILRNVKQLTRLDKNAKVSIRMNVDAHNASEYHRLFDYVRRFLGSDRISVHPGFVDNYTLACSSTESCMLDRPAQAEFYIDQYKRYGIYGDWFYPKVTHGNCMARYVNSFVVGPKGELYKCLAAVGMGSMSIGDVNNPGNAITDEGLMSEFLRGNDYLDSPTCRQCALFPVCDGGCPFLKLREKIVGEPHDNCMAAKGYMAEFLDSHIDWKYRTDRHSLEGRHRP